MIDLILAALCGGFIGGFAVLILISAIVLNDRDDDE